MSRASIGADVQIRHRRLIVDTRRVHDPTNHVLGQIGRDAGDVCARRFSLQVRPNRRLGAGNARNGVTRSAAVRSYELFAARGVPAVRERHGVCLAMRARHSRLRRALQNAMTQRAAVDSRPCLTPPLFSNLIRTLGRARAISRSWTRSSDARSQLAKRKSAATR